MSKITLRIPTKDQYAYIEKEIEVDGVDANQNYIKSMYDELYALMNGGQAVSELVFNAYLIELMNSDLTKPLNAEFYESLTKSQVEVVQSVKRLKKRLQAANQE